MAEATEAKPRQSKLPNFVDIEDDAVEALAEKYRDQTDKWLEAQKVALETEKELTDAFNANKKLVAAAKAHPKKKVKVGDFILTLTVKDPTQKIKVKHLDAESDSE